MKITRMFLNDEYKGTKNYLKEQTVYEIARTVLYFAISASLFIAGFVSTGSRENLLTIVAVLGCLPACKSLVDMIMFLRFKGCSPEAMEEIEAHTGDLNVLYDMVFTAYDRCYNVSHLAVKGNTICGYTQDEKIDEQSFVKHLDSLLKKDGYKDVTIKVFKDIRKYTARLEQLQQLETNEAPTAGILSTLKSVVL